MGRADLGKFSARSPARLLTGICRCSFASRAARSEENVTHQPEMVRGPDAARGPDFGAGEGELRLHGLAAKLRVGTPHEDIINAARGFARHACKVVLPIEGRPRAAIGSVRPSVCEEDALLVHHG